MRHPTLRVSSFKSKDTGSGLDFYDTGIEIEDFYACLTTGNKVEVIITELEDLVKNKETDWGHIKLTPKSLIEEKYVEVLCDITFKSGTKKTFGIVIDLTNKEYTWTEC